jgi:HlyD family secretion protein
MTKTVRVWALGAVVIVVVALTLWWSMGGHRASSELTLYGNVDLRQVELSFMDNARVEAVLVEEGDSVHQGQVLARLDTSRLTPQVDKAAADVAAQQQVVERQEHGNRPEEIAQARANVDAASADAANARAQYERMRALSDSSAGRAVSRQDMDSARASQDSAEAKLAMNQKALALQLAGPRKEDVAQSRAVLRAYQAQLALLQQQLKDANLTAPLNAVVRSRIIEPGDMASPQKPAFTLAIADPKWIRTYITEADLGMVHEGMSTEVSVDAYQGRRFSGHVGFISPVAEFTPKSVETTELRSSLVYEVRVLVQDPGNDLRLGMPATVHLPHAKAAAG